MKRKKLLYFLSIFIIMAFSSTSLAAIPVKVSVGKGTIITLKEPSKRISLSNPDIADLNLISPKEILINGKKVGSTNLIVWDTMGKASFFDIAVFGDMTTLEAQIKELAPGADVTVEAVEDSLVLKGTMNNKRTIDKIEELARAYSPKVINHIVIREAQQILLEVKVAQIDKGALENLGVSFLVKGLSAEGFSNLVGAPSTTTTTIAAGGTTVTTTSGGAGGIAGNVPGLGPFTPLDPFQAGVSYFPSGIGVVLKALASKDLAKILAEPNMVVRSGEEGKFLVGTKVPVQTVTGVGTAQTVSITFVDVGVKLNFKPEVLETGVIRLKIDPAEVSNITQFIAFSGILAPEIDTRQVSTSVDLKDGESLILAGLLSDEMKKNIQKIPLFGDIPILGAIFRSTKEELLKKELAFFITPRLVKPIPQGEKIKLPAERPLTPDEEREFKWIPVPRGSEETK